MSIVQSTADLGLSSLTPEFKKTAESAASTINIKVGETVDSNNQQAVNSNQQLKEQSANKEPLTPEQLEKVAQQLQDSVAELNRGLEFSVDKDSGRDVIKVFDKSRGDLVKQFPSEEVLTLVAKLSEMVGGFIDAKV